MGRTKEIIEEVAGNKFMVDLERILGGLKGMEGSFTHIPHYARKLPFFYYIPRRRKISNVELLDGVGYAEIGKPVKVLNRKWDRGSLVEWAPSWFEDSSLCQTVNDILETLGIGLDVISPDSDTVSEISLRLKEQGLSSLFSEGLSYIGYRGHDLLAFFVVNYRQKKDVEIQLHVKKSQD